MTLTEKVTTVRIRRMKVKALKSSKTTTLVICCQVMEKEWVTWMKTRSLCRMISRRKTLVSMLSLMASRDKSKLRTTRVNNLHHGRHRPSSESPKFRRMNKMLSKKV